MQESLCNSVQPIITYPKLFLIPEADLRFLPWAGLNFIHMFKRPHFVMIFFFISLHANGIYYIKWLLKIQLMMYSKVVLHTSAIRMVRGRLSRKKYVSRMSDMCFDENQDHIRYKVTSLQYIIDVMYLLDMLYVLNSCSFAPPPIRSWMKKCAFII